MKQLLWFLAVGVLVSLGFSISNWRHRAQGAESTQLARNSDGSMGEIQRLFSQLREEVVEIRNEQAIAKDSPNHMVQRVEALESAIEEIRGSLKTLNFEEESENRDALFRGEFGYEKADEFAALGNHAIAGNGYLLFLEAHPDHPDARDIMGKAREAYWQAGYKDKAGWVQTQMVESYPDNLSKDAQKMALMLKQQHRYDEALEYIDKAAGAATNDVDRLWRLSYRAFLIEQRDGNAAGAEAYRELTQQIDAANLSEDRLGIDTRDRLADLEKRLAQQGG